MMSKSVMQHFQIHLGFPNNAISIARSWLHSWEDIQTCMFISATFNNNLAPSSDDTIFVSKIHSITVIGQLTNADEVHLQIRHELCSQTQLSITASINSNNTFR